MSRLEELYEEMHELSSENASYTVKLDLGEDENPLYAIKIMGGRVPEGKVLIRKTLMIEKGIKELLSEYYALPKKDEKTEE